MKALGYVLASDVDFTARHVDGALLATPEWPGWEGHPALALVSVADLDVEAAVERAARFEHDEDFPLDARLTWDNLHSDLKDEYRRQVRPLVLAVLGVEP